MASPGPNVLLVARTSMAESRRAGLYSAAGVATGSGAWAAAAAVGVALLFASAPAAEGVVRVLGGLYLIYLGVATFRAATSPVRAGERRPGGVSAGRAWRQGTLTNLSNPKALVFYASIFAALLPDSSPGFRGAAVALIVVNALAWHAVLAVTLSTRRAQVAYASAKRGIDRGAGAVMAGFGVVFALGLV